MEMTIEHKKKCSEIWEGYTGFVIEPHRWNEEAASILAEYVGEVIKCSHGLKMFESLFPHYAKKLGWLDVIRIPEKLYRANRKFKKELEEGYVNYHCATTHLVNYRTAINKAILMGK